MSIILALFLVFMPMVTEAKEKPQAHVILVSAPGVVGNFPALLDLPVAVKSVTVSQSLPEYWGNYHSWSYDWDQEDLVVVVVDPTGTPQPYLFSGVTSFCNVYLKMQYWVTGSEPFKLEGACSDTNYRGTTGGEGSALTVPAAPVGDRAVQVTGARGPDRRGLR